MRIFTWPLFPTTHRMTRGASAVSAMKSIEWKTYRTRFLVKAKQLGSSLSFVDNLGRQHSGRKGDYLVESSDGVITIAPRQIFEDIYVAMSQLDDIAANALDAISTLDPSTPHRSATVHSTIDRRNFESLQFERIKAPKTDDSTRLRRKLPQPCRDRRTSSPRLGLM